MHASLSGELGETRMAVDRTACVVAGGGPAGMMLGLLLARAGIEVRVLEKHADFLRDFRGDTIHPSTLQVMDELGLLDGLLALPIQRRIIAPVLGSRAPLRPPLFLRLVDRFPFLRGIPAGAVGLGVRPKHVRLP
jgi:hypothetical protein